MHKTNKNALAILSFALASAMAAPAAFAQSAATTPQDPAAQAAPQQAPVTQAAPAVAPAQKTWSELDANGNGSLSATEAAPIESLAKVFGKADKDGNGELTADEYKAWLAANGGKPKAGQG